MEGVFFMLSEDRCERLMNALVELGVSYLKEDGYFFPFGVVLKCDGVVDVVEGYVGDDFPNPGVLLSGVREDCGRLVAGGGILGCGVAWDVSVGVDVGGDDFSDGIMMNIEDIDGYCVRFVLPYSLGLFGRVRVGALVRREGECFVF